jgi:hypothetical protein
MTTKFSLSFLVIGLSFLIYACTNDETEPAVTIPFENSNLEVWVKIETDTGLINAIGAQVILYESEENRRDDVKRNYDGTTGADGRVRFTAMAKPEYWIWIIAPDGRSKFFAEDGTAHRTPGHPIALNKLDVVFEK